MTGPVPQLDAILATVDFRPGSDNTATVLVSIVELIRQFDTAELQTGGAKRLINYIATNPGVPISFSSQILVFVGFLVEVGGDPEEIAHTYVPILTTLTLGVDTEIAAVSEGDREGASGEWEEYLDRLQTSGTAILSHSLTARRLASEDESLWRATAKLRWKAGFLYKIVSAPDQEDLIVMHPAEGWGFLVRISGITKNWQLQPLLAHHLRELVSPARWAPLHPAVVACLSGEGPCEIDATLVGIWNMYSWTGVDANGVVDWADMSHWVWGEGVPKDILTCPVLENKRVLLLGYAHMLGASISRSMNCCRDFLALKAEVEVIEPLGERMPEYLRLLAAVGEDVKNTAVEDWSKVINRG